MVMEFLGKRTNMKSLFVEVADTDPKRSYGLMDRRQLPENQGMVFRFPTARRLTFWMKNTYIPLDIAFIDDYGRITQIEEMFPLSTRAIVSQKRCRYALEVNRGWFLDNDIGVGDVIAGEGITQKRGKRLAQVVVDGPMEIPEEAQAQQPNDPDVMLNRTVKDIFMDADMKGQKLIVLYQTKGGLTLPPKLVSGPFTFEPDADKMHDAIVKVWDHQTGGWKSFIIDNILSVEPEIQPAQEIPTLKEESALPV